MYYHPNISKSPKTYCNPINISYRYQPGANARESADPCAVVFRGEYYLFASHGSGYWWSEDMHDWKFIRSYMPEINFFAPAACVVGDTLYLTHSEGGAIYKTTDPKNDKWERVGRPVDWLDPALLTDDDGRVYCYYGCSATQPIYGVELDPANDMALVSGPHALFEMDLSAHGFEIPGDFNEHPQNPCWMEGAWMNKHEGKYYLQYAAPGTASVSYADGCYVSDKPLGPFTYCPNSPIAYKSTGFVAGSGHGSLVRDLTGRWWKLGTVVISIHFLFERRLMITPAQFDHKGRLVNNTVYGDYPTYRAHTGLGSFDAPTPGWQLLSYKAAAAASSSFRRSPPALAFNESAQDWWATDDDCASLTGDLGECCEIRALQVNFADQYVKSHVLYRGERDVHAPAGRDHDGIHRYTLEVSEDGENYTMLIDRSDAVARPEMAEDTTHDYYELSRPVRARYVRLSGRGPAPARGRFAVSGLRVFGLGNGALPAEVTGVSVARDPSSPLRAEVTWDPSEGAEGYIVRFGPEADCLNSHYRVWEGNSQTITILNRGVDYVCRVDSFNRSGETPGKKLYYF